MALKPVAFRGLDLMSPVTMTEPGSLKECLNYEYGIQNGLTRSGGFERVDGNVLTAGVGRFRLVRFSYVVADSPSSPGFGAISPVLDQFMRLVVNNVVVAEGVALSEYDTWTGSQFPSVLAIFTGASDLSGNGITGVGGVDRFTIDFVESEAFGTVNERVTVYVSGISVVDAEIEADDAFVERYNEALAALLEYARQSVLHVPGGDGSDIIGTFGLKNRLYAIRDLKRLDVSSGIYTDANEGQFVTIGASEYEVLAVTQLSGDATSLSLHPVAGSGANATGLKSPVQFEITGTAPDADVGVDYNELAAGFSFGTTGGGGGLVWSIVDDAFATSTLIDADSPSLVSQQTNAALWKADDNGWTMVDTGREMLFSGGTTALAAFIRDAVLDGATVKTTGNKFPTVGLLNGASETGFNTDNGTLANLSGASGDIFVGTAFDFTGIPSSAIIRGITVTVERRSDTANQARDNTITLVGLGGGAENKARGTAWPNAIAVATYGGATDLWGNQSISVADLQDADFGVMVIADRFVGATAAIGGIDYIAVNVSYVERDSPAYVWNGTTDQAITIRHVQFLGGDTAASTAYGYLTITCPQNADKTRIIDVGDSIRTAAAGAGDVLAVVAARDVPIWFPGQDDIDNNNSAYESEATNFYASDSLDAAYIVCGVGPCTVYDGARTIRIRTQLPAIDDNPRHVARIGERLALGFYGGVLAQSRATDPFEMRSERGASYTPFGDRITGVRQRVADELLVPCESSLQFFTGLTNATGMRQVITRTRGMQEYTDADVGLVLGCDGLGIFDIRTTYTFGPATRNYLSMPVAPWLQPRLQATDNAGQASIRPLIAWAKRSKNQYCLGFADGYILTMTTTEPPEFTIQRLVSPSDKDLPLAIRALCTWIDASGRERVFASFRHAKEGYMFELDAGRSYDGDVIDAHIVLNPISMAQGAPTIMGQADQTLVYGTGYGYANLTVSRAANYQAPDPTNYVPLVMGSESAAVSALTQPFRGAFDFPIEAYDVIWRFDSSTATEGPHTLQLITFNTNARGNSRGHTGN